MRMAGLARYRRKPTEVQAIQFTGNNTGDIWDAFGADGIYGPTTEKNPDHLILTTAHGDPAIKPDIFAATYDVVLDGE